jgi:hypothetical protein
MGQPFHAEAPSGTRHSTDLCEFPDVLKEIVFVLYENRPLCEKIFAKLGVLLPSGEYGYKRYITKRQDGGIFGAYKVINAYLDIRESEGMPA